MTDNSKITIPDIGGATDVDVIEVLVSPGDTIEKDTPLITLESDKDFNLNYQKIRTIKVPTQKFWAHRFRTNAGKVLT